MADNRPELDFRLKLEIELKENEKSKGIVIEDAYGDDTKGLDISFEIDKSYTTAPTQSTIKIYNMSVELYNLILEKANAFRLSCARGKDAEYTPFYTGFPIRTVKVAKDTVLTSNQGFMKQDANAGRAGQNDLETTITLMNYGFAQLFKSYQLMVSVDMVIQDCINALGLPRGNIDENVKKRIEGSVLAQGFTVRGEVAQILNMLGDVFGFNWNTNDMKLNLYDKNRQDIKTYGVVLTPENSSTPERQDDKFKARTKTIKKATKTTKGVKATTIEKSERGYKIKTMLLPFLQCGSTCYLQDFEMSGAEGEKYIYRLRHVGSNTGTECYTEVYCV